MSTKKSLKWPFARMLLAVAGLAVAVIVTVAVVGADSGLPGYTPGKMGPQPNAPLTGTKGHVTCDLPGQPNTVVGKTSAIAGQIPPRTYHI